MNLTPWSLSGQLKERDDHYKLRYVMPGIAKEEVKITIDDGVLTIKGEHKEEMMMSIGQQVAMYPTTQAWFCLMMPKLMTLRQS